MAEFVRLTTTSFISDFDDTLAWLASRGFDKPDRLRRYRDVIRRLSSIRSNDELKKAYDEAKNKGQLNEVLSSYAEGIDFVESLTCLRKIAVDIPDALLKTVLSGPADASIETAKSNQGRNAMFELSMASAIAKAGLRPVLTLTNPDVAFDFQGRRVMIECKRLTSRNKIRANVSDAIKQLERSVTNNSLGLVALCVSRLYHQGDVIMTVPSADAAYHFLADGLQGLMTWLRPQLEQMMSPPVAGILLYVSSPVCINDLGYVPLNTAGLFPMNTGEAACMMSLCSVLRF